MNTYLLSVRSYSDKEQRFKVEAPDSYEAIMLGREHVKTAPQFAGGNWRTDSVRYIKKIRRRRTAKTGAA